MCGSEAWARELRQRAWDRADGWPSKKPSETKAFDEYQDGWLGCC